MSEPSQSAEPAVLERRTIVARDASTGEPLREVLCASAEEVADAVRRARTAQRDWGSRPVGDRVRALRPVLERMSARRDEIARIVSVETGKPRAEALATEVLPALDAADFALRQAPRVLRESPLAHRLAKPTRSSLRREPWGVVGVLAPRGAPFLVPAQAAVFALAAGNAVLVKPSPHAPLAALELEAILRSAGVAPALFHCLPGDDETGAALVDAGCELVSFAGSTASGRRVAAACGERLLPLQLQLPGKDVAIVLADAPVERAARALAWASLSGAGRAGGRVERVLVQGEVSAVFADRFVTEVSRLRTGPDRGFDADVGPVASREEWEAVSRHVEDARARGAIVLAGGRGKPGAGDKGGWFWEPTVLSHVPEGALVLEEETPGPVVSLAVVSGEEEAVRRANASRACASASVWTTDGRAAGRLARRLDVASVAVNDVLVPGLAAESPGGGVKLAGHGRPRGAEGLLALTRGKHVAFDRGLVAESPFWFPYGRERYESLSAVIPSLFGLGSRLERITSLARAARTFLGKKES